MADLGHRIPLQTILAADAATCTIMGALLAFASVPIAGLTGISGPFLFVSGLLLLPIAMFMAVFARAATIPAWAVGVIVAGNVLWVLGSVILPITGMISPNGLGWTFLLLQAVAVAIFAGIEWRARQHSRSFA